MVGNRQREIAETFEKRGQARRSAMPRLTARLHGAKEKCRSAFLAPSFRAEEVRYNLPPANSAVGYAAKRTG